MRKQMLQISLFSLLILTSFQSSKAQDWIDAWKDDQTSFENKQAAYQQYFSGKNLSATKGWKQFKRWEYYYQRMMGTPQDFYEAKKAMLQQFEENRLNQSHNNAVLGNWSFIGPSITPSQGGGAGRVNAIEFLPGNTDIYAGAPSGGLWKRTGTSWSTNTDNLSFLGFSDIVINSANPNQMYAATGDADAGDARCIGVLKSNDGGNTWSSAGLTNVSAIYKLLVSPTNFNRILAGTPSGIFLSTDGGASWTNTLSLSNLTIYDLEFKPGDPNIVYAASSNNLFLSTDGGLLFTNISAAAGLPTTGGRRRAIAVTPANPDVLYLLIARSDNYGLHSFWRSENSGGSFTKMLDGVTGTLNLLGWSSTGSDVAAGGQGWYDLSLAADPANPNTVFVGGVNIWRTTDGGTTWTINGHWTGTGAPYVHADIHNLKFNAATGELFAGTDGGVFKLTNINTTPNWTDLSNGLQIAQMYRIGASQTNEGLLISGWQDNGTNLRQNATNNWKRVIGGDGMESVIDPTNANIMLGEIYYGRISKSTNGGLNWSTIIGSGGTPGTVDEDGPWVTNYGMAKSNTNTYYVGKTNVYKSTTGAAPFSAGIGIPSGGQIGALAIAPSDANVVYASKGGSVYVTTDGTNFSLKNTGLPGLTVGYITVHGANPNIAWATLNGFTNNQKVYKTINGGQNWTNVSGNLPNTGVFCITVNEQAPHNQLYIGTETGVYYTNDTLGTWIEFDNGLPNTEVSELEIVYSAGKIIAGTYGRGAWESPLYAPPPADCGATVPVSDFTANATTVCPAQTITLTNNSTNCQSVFQWSFPGGTPSSSTAINPTVNYATAGTYTISLNVTTPGGTATKNMMVTVTPQLTHLFSIAASAVDICAGQNVTFTSTSSNAGSNPSIIWLKNGNAIPGTAGLTSISLNTLNNGDLISAEEISSFNCAVPNKITTAGIVFTVSPNLTHSFSISTPKVLICADESATFTTTASNSGNAPIITWYNKGVAIAGANGKTSITLSNITDGSSITAIETSNAKCVSPATITSNAIPMTVTVRPEKPLITQVVGDLFSSISYGNQWFKNNATIPNADGMVYRPSVNGTYQTQVTINGCSSPVSDEYMMNISGVNKLYPVPASNGHFTFLFYAPEDARNYQISVFTATGQLIHSESNNILPGLNKIDYKWGKLSAGIYYLKATAGTATYTKTLLIR